VTYFLHFPTRTDIINLEEKQALGLVGGLFVAIAQELGNLAAPLILVVSGGADGINALQSFSPRLRAWSLPSLRAVSPSMRWQSRKPLGRDMEGKG
jgi:hypothetical protein